MSTPAMPVDAGNCVIVASRAFPPGNSRYGDEEKEYLRSGSSSGSAAA
jgi:hypothetical protein